MGVVGIVYNYLFALWVKKTQISEAFLKEPHSGTSLGKPGRTRNPALGRSNLDTFAVVFPKAQCVKCVLKGLTVMPGIRTTGISE